MAPGQSTVDPSGPPLVPFFDIDGSQDESPQLKAVIEKLKLEKHIEGGYFVETDRDSLRVPNPFKHGEDKENDTRNASTTIHYLITTKSPLGAFHRNKARTVHTLHSGRGRYILIHADEVAGPGNPGGYGADESVPESQQWSGKARVETFIVGHNVLKGERLQWIVEGGKYKCSYLLPDDEDGQSSEGLLISETVVPGFEFSDHDFMKPERMDALVTKEQAEEMQWMLRKADQ